MQVFNSRQIATVLHDAGTRNIVIFCHGFRGSSIGPSRFFVRAARLLEERGVSSLRFDQYGSGNSAGDFKESSFIGWVEMIKAIAGVYLAQQYNVALFGQSMGASAAIAAAAQLKGLVALVAWVPDPEIEDFMAPPESPVEEGGQVVTARFWQEAHAARVAAMLATLETPAYIVQCTADEYVDEKNRAAVAAGAKARHKLETFDGYAHSAWSAAQAEEIIGKSVAFLQSAFPAAVAAPPSPPRAQMPAPVRPASSAVPDDTQQKIAALLREAEREKKPAFPHGTHFMRAVMTGGLSVPWWLWGWLRHNRAWREKRDNF